MISVAILAAMAAFSAWSGTVNERIAFLDSTGRSAIWYATTRSDYSSYTLFLGDSKEGQSEQEVLAPYLYVNPNDYQIQHSEEPPPYRLHFGQGDFATMRRRDLSSELTEKSNGNLVYETANTPAPNGHFGFWNGNEPFSDFAFAMVFPDNLEPVKWSSNREGAWVRRKNTLSWFGHDVNDVVLTYGPRSRGTLDAMRGAVRSIGDARVESVEDGVRVVLGDTILFESGSADLSKAGREVIGRVARAIDSKPGAKIVVEGHTDDRPISGDLAQRFPTNWELSAARAIEVVHALAAGGVNEKRLEARAFGSTRPRESNDAAAGRAANRRIELLIVER